MTARSLTVALAVAALLAGCGCDAWTTLEAAREGVPAAVHAAGELGDPVVPTDFLPTPAPPQQEAFASLAPIVSTSTDTHLRLTALEALRRLATRAPHVARDFYPDVFEPALVDHDPEVRWRAAWTLGRLGRTSPALRRLIADPHPRVAERAAWAAGRAGDAEAIPALREALGRGGAVAASAEAALAQILP